MFTNRNFVWKAWEIFTSKTGRLHDKIDLQDTYGSVPVAPKSRCFQVFIFDGKIFGFKVMPFGLNSAPRVFTKLFKPILRPLRSQGMLLIIYLDDLLQQQNCA